jgi:hypothetical protein
VTLGFPFSLFSDGSGFLSGLISSDRGSLSRAVHRSICRLWGRCYAKCLTLASWRATAGKNANGGSSVCRHGVRPLKRNTRHKWAPDSVRRTVLLLAIGAGIWSYLARTFGAPAKTSFGKSPKLACKRVSASVRKARSSMSDWAVNLELAFSHVTARSK